VVRAGAISGPDCCGSWTTHLHGIELADMYEMAALAAGTDALRSVRRCRPCRLVLAYPGRLGGGWVGGRDRRAVKRQELSGSCGGVATARMPEAGVSHLVQPLRQHVLQEAAHELVTMKTRLAPSPRCTMLVADGDADVVELDDAALGDGNTKHIASEVAQHRLGTITPRGAVNDPGLRPCRPGQDEIGTGAGEGGFHFGAHENGECLGRNEVVPARGMPVPTIVGGTTTGDEAMHMRMAEPSLKIPGIIISLIFSEQRKLVFRATPLQN